jgi:hypothetical protein
MFDQYIMDVSDFTFVRRLSAGAFAKVFLARRKDTGQYCAIKVETLWKKLWLLSQRGKEQSQEWKKEREGERKGEGGRKGLGDREGKSRDSMREGKSGRWNEREGGRRVEGDREWRVYRWQKVECYEEVKGILGQYGSSLKIFNWNNWSGSEQWGVHKRKAVRLGLGLTLELH